MTWVAVTALVTLAAVCPLAAVQAYEAGAWWDCALVFVGGSIFAALIWRFEGVGR